MAKSDNSVRLRYEEQIYDVDYNGNTYKVSIIEDLEYGDVEAVVMKYKKGQLVVPTEKQRQSVLIFFNENRD